MDSGTPTAFQSGDVPQEMLEQDLVSYKEKLKTLTEMHGLTPSMTGKTSNERKKEQRKRKLGLPKAFKCEICGKDFHYQGLLNRHRRSHTSLRPFKCRFCARSVKSLTNLGNHMRNHHPGCHMYECAVCQEPFQFMKELKMHRIHVHHILEEPRTSFLLQTSENVTFSGGKNLKQQMSAAPLLQGKSPQTEPDQEGVVAQEDDNLKANICELESEITVSKKTYSCDCCEARFNYAYQLEDHRRVHTGERPFSCHVCEYSFKKLSALLDHFKGKHPKNKPYRCEFCLEEFRFNKDLKIHKYSFHESDNKSLDENFVKGEESTSSLISKKSFMSKANGKTKERVKTDGQTLTTKPEGGARNELVCEYCCKEFEVRHLLVQHRRSHAHDRPFSCSWCSTTYKSRQALTVHMNAKHPGKKKYRCTSCDLQFLKQSELEGHNYSVHESGDTSIDCILPLADPSELFSGRGAFEKGDEHESDNKSLEDNFVEGEESTSSLIPEKSFMSKENGKTEERLKTDGQTVTTKPEGGARNDLVCEFCCKEFKVRHLLVQHRRSHGDDRPFACSWCSTTYKSRSALTVHMNVKHPGKKKYRCTSCDLQFLRQSELEGHNYSVHESGDTSIDCILPLADASELFSGPAAFEKGDELNLLDLKVKEEPIEGFSIAFECEGIVGGGVGTEVSYPTEAERAAVRNVAVRNFACDTEDLPLVIKHLNEIYEYSLETDGYNPSVVPEVKMDPIASKTEKHSTGQGDTVLLCNFCGASFTTAAGMGFHMRKLHPESLPFQCLVCSGRFASTIALARHLEAHASASPIICGTCGKQFLKRASLKSHVSKVHVKEKGFFCDICSDSFSTLYYFKMHRKRHFTSEGELRPVPARNVPCEFCFFRFVNKRQLQTHVSQMHPNIKPYSCKYCPLSFRTHKLLREHRQEVHAVLAHTCDICGSKVSYLRDHARRVHGVILHDDPSAKRPDRILSQPLKCEKCDKTFHSAGSLRSHKTRKHQGAMKCGLCDYSIQDYVLLKVHRYKQHGIEGARKYPCETCGKVFYLGFRLRNHQKIHRGVKDFSCNVCNRAFRNRSTLTVHKLKKHTVRAEAEAEVQQTLPLIS